MERIDDQRDTRRKLFAEMWLAPYDSELAMLSLDEPLVDSNGETYSVPECGQNVPSYLFLHELRAAGIECKPGDKPRRVRLAIGAVEMPVKAVT